jgi:Pup amidohydrolase
VAALHDVSWDVSCRQTIRLRDGRRLRALELQWEYLDLAKKWVKETEPTGENSEVLQWWETVLTGIEEEPLSLHRELDWVAKHRVLSAYRDRDELEWKDPKLALVDLQYHDVRRARGLYYKLVDGGKMERLVSDAEVGRAVSEPPEDTRAYFRGRCIQRYPGSIAAASWDSIIFDTGQEALQRVPMREPLRGTKEHVGELLETSEAAADLVATLQQ